MTQRWARARSRWLPQDGLVRVTPAMQADAATRSGSARGPYSLSALQKFATCPYQFLLSAIYRLQPNDEPEPLQRLDPLTRGALFHEVQAEFFRSLQAHGTLPLDAGRRTGGDPPGQSRRWPTSRRPTASGWRRPSSGSGGDEIAAIGRDLRVWVRRLPDAGEWRPSYFEFSFGLSDEGRDPRSVSEPVTIDGRFRLRGSVDLVEVRQNAQAAGHRSQDRQESIDASHGDRRRRHAAAGALRHGDRGGPRQAGAYRVGCSTAPRQAGSPSTRFRSPTANRRAGLEALEIVDRAIELGFLPPAPAERACTWCDFRAVCGPDEARRVARKPPEPLGDLQALRERP